MERFIVPPDAAALRKVFGADLEFSPDAPTDEERERARARARRAYRLRLTRAERAGLLPRRVYLSTQRFGYWSTELDAKLATLPTNYAAFGSAAA